ncbi:MAG: DMT family transporter [Vicinamibacterales bacterium]|jgi:drug/metabolite transporter (DMT)-like permease|nr:DMT family transporter [Vicinamibacterales bacterium]MDP6608080.1 DMT family transporter [Vicinamibacterales bacterium]|tara:strand:+ start:9991 stop:10890 length:900 start_codon:yes stop_codon:yes gene_type:complete
MSSAPRTLAYVVWLATTIVWGTTWVVIRIGLDDLSPLLFSASRAALGAAVFLVVAAATAWDRRPGLAEIRFWALVGGPQLGLPYALIFWAEQTISSGLTATLFATFPAFTAVGAHLLLRDEPLSWLKLGGTVLAFVGVAVLVGPTTGPGPVPLLPIVAVLVAAASGAMAAVIVRRHGRETSTVWLTAIQIAGAAIFLIVLAAIFEPNPRIALTTRAVASIAYLGIAVTGGCYFGLFWLLKRLDVTLVSMSVGGEATVAVFLGAWILGEPVGLRSLLGLSLVVASVALVSLHSKADAVGP